ncbi:MAG TPA: hypothetical protein VM621_07990 [Luteibacter sp.]|uniref:Tc toxin subunit A-related protein n=1 Tax=Luteibacter sp. TaxID=1886636 RepID=UPI002C12EAB9|nr:hypothetical protein [Luteibacter sp.]HVI54976.1 hypothetical protein [Luteibacter sp.]
MVERRRDYYQGLDDDGHLAMEQAASTTASLATAWKAMAIPFNTVGASIGTFPNIFGMANGGHKPGRLATEIGATLGTMGEIAAFTTDELRWQASFERDRAGWKNEVVQANCELAVIDRQLAEQDIQIRAATLTVENEKARQAIMKEEYIFMTTGFAIGPTYVWMIAHLSDIYAAAYDAVMSLCLAAQDCWRYETGDFTTRFIKPGAWMDNWRGMLAGDALQRDLTQMEAAYLRGRERRMHIRKTVSLAKLNGLTANALATEIENKQAITFALPSSLYDADFPGHYLRQIVGVSVTFRMASSNEVQSIAAVLTQTSNTLLIKPDIEGAAYIYDNSKPDPGTVLANLRHEQKIAVSTTKPVIDIDGYSGLFSLTFGDDRYLPFEGTGAISNWTLSFPGDKDTLLSTVKRDATGLLEDIVVTVDYTAADGGETFAQGVRELRSAAETGAPAGPAPAGNPKKPPVVVPAGFSAPRVVIGSQGPSVSIAPHPSVPAGTTVVVTYTGADGKAVSTTAQSWNGRGLTLPIARAMLGANAGKRLSVAYTVDEAGKSTTSPAVEVMLPEAGQLDNPTFPTPVAPQVRANHAIDRRDTLDGATITVAPWAYIQKGQSIWLRCVGIKADGSTHDHDLRLPPAGITEEEARHGLDLSIPPDYLDALGDYAQLRVVLKISLDGSGDESKGTAFPELKLDIPGCRTVTARTSEWAKIEPQLDPSLKSNFGFVATTEDVGPVGLVFELGSWEISIPAVDSAGNAHRVILHAGRWPFPRDGGSSPPRRFGSYRPAKDNVDDRSARLCVRFVSSQNAHLPPGRYVGSAVVQLIGWQIPVVRESIVVQVDVTQPEPAPPSKPTPKPDPKATPKPGPKPTQTAPTTKPAAGTPTEASPVIVHPAKIRKTAPDVYIDAAGEVSILLRSSDPIQPGDTVLYWASILSPDPAKGMEKIWTSASMAADSPDARCAVPADILTRHVEKSIEFTCEHSRPDKRSGVAFVHNSWRTVLPARLDPLVLPTPAMPKAATSGTLDRRTAADGATVTVAPWPYAQEDQALWLRCEGKDAKGARADLELRLPPTHLTANEVRDGLAQTIPASYLNTLGANTELKIVLKVSLDGGSESTARAFPVLTVKLP